MQAEPSLKHLTAVVPHRRQRRAGATAPASGYPRTPCRAAAATGYDNTLATASSAEPDCSRRGSGSNTSGLSTLSRRADAARHNLAQMREELASIKRQPARASKGVAARPPRPDRNAASTAHEATHKKSHVRPAHASSELTNTTRRLYGPARRKAAQPEWLDWRRRRRTLATVYRAGGGSASTPARSLSSSKLDSACQRRGKEVQPEAPPELAESTKLPPILVSQQPATYSFPDVEALAARCMARPPWLPPGSCGA